MKQSCAKLDALAPLLPRGRGHFRVAQRSLRALHLLVDIPILCRRARKLLEIAHDLRRHAIRRDPNAKRLYAGRARIGV